MPPPSTTTRLSLPTRRFRFTPRAAWLGARARNVLQRRWRLATAGVAAFAVVFLGYLLLPAGVLGLTNLVARDRTARSDTTALLAREVAARRQLTEATAALTDVRERHLTAVGSVVTAVLSPADAARRDSLSRVAGTLGSLIQRAENAPIPESYRALGDAEAVRSDPRVRALADSLAEIQREREELGSGATIDPVFVALTSQANTLGRGIQTIAEARLAELKQEIARLQAPQLVPDSAAIAAAPDTLAAALARATAARAMADARLALAAGRAANAAADSLAASERSRTQLAPIPVLMAGALTIAIALTFALALIDEMRSPRVADAAEAERLTMLRVLTGARLRAVPPDRLRRAADRAIPVLVDPTHDSHRILAWHLTAQWPNDGIVTVTGDDPLVAATVAANLAAVLAVDARITLLVDADFDAEPVRHVLALPKSPGLAAVLENRRKWSEALLTVTVGRSRTLDVLPSGSRARPPGPAESEALVGEIRRAARRHDATVVVASPSGARRTRAGDDVIVCATKTKTRLATLARTVATLIDEGARVRGVVLWDGELPSAKRAAERSEGSTSTRAA